MRGLLDGSAGRFVIRGFRWNEMIDGKRDNGRERCLLKKIFFVLDRPLNRRVAVAFIDKSCSYHKSHNIPGIFERFNPVP